MMDMTYRAQLRALDLWLTLKGGPTGHGPHLATGCIAVKHISRGSHRVAAPRSLPASTLYELARGLLCLQATS